MENPNNHSLTSCPFSNHFLQPFSSSIFGWVACISSLILWTWKEVCVCVCVRSHVLKNDKILNCKVSSRFICYSPTVVRSILSKSKAIATITSTNRRDSRHRCNQPFHSPPPILAPWFASPVSSDDLRNEKEVLRGSREFSQRQRQLRKSKESKLRGKLKRGRARVN